MQYLNEFHEEWNRMWEQLAKHPINQGDSTCQYGVNRWLYMGSSDTHHHFKHGLHPVTRQEEYVYIESQQMILTEKMK